MRRRPTPEALPLWHEVLALEEVLRPRAFAELRAQRRVANPWVVVALLLATLAGVACWALALERQALLVRLETLGRPATEVESFASYVTLDRLSGVWLPMTLALATGVVAALVGLVVPSTRRFFLRHPVAPVVIGASLYLGIQQLLLVR